jgi:hypothetical protein
MPEVGFDLLGKYTTLFESGGNIKGNINPIKSLRDTVISIRGKQG